MRVILFTEASGGGVGRHLRWIGPALARAGIETEIWVSPRRADPDFLRTVAEWRESGCHVTLLPLPRRPAPIADLRGTLRLRRALKQQSPCILHTHAAKAGIIGRRAAHGLPGVHTVHSPHAFFFEAWPEHTLRRRLGIALESRLARYTDAYVFVSAAEAAIARRLPGFPVHRAHHIPNGLPEDWERKVTDRAAARDILGLPPDAIVVGFVGRFCTQKAPETLIRALAHPALRERPGLRACFCGTGPARQEKRLRALVEKLRVTARIHWPGYIPDAGRILRAFDVLALPSRYEAHPYILLESLAAGTPPAVSDIPGHRLLPQIDALVDRFPPDSPDSLAQTLATVLDRPPEDTRVRTEQARRETTRAFRLERQVEALIALYRSLTSFKND